MRNRLSPSVFFSGRKPTYYKRPDKAKILIDENFKQVSGPNMGNGYIFTGSPEYSFTVNNIKVHSGLLAKKINILDEENPIVVLDIGAGDFSFKHNNDQLYGRKVITYGIAANDSFRRTDLKIDDEFHQFANAEYLSEIYGKDKFDFIFSCRTFIHFIDPVGSIIEAYKTLKLGGILLIDDFFIPGCERYTQSILHYLKQQGYLLVTSNSLHNINNFMIKKTDDKPELLFPVKFDAENQSDDVIHYQPTTELVNFHDNRRSTTSLAYQQGCKFIFNTMHDSSHTMIDSINDLPSLFANATYQSLETQHQYLSILAIVAKIMEYRCLSTLCKEAKSVDHHSRYTDNFSRLYSEIKAANQSLLYSLSSHPRFQFYHGTQSNLSTTSANEQQLRIIQVAAMHDIIRMGKKEVTKKELDKMGLPYTETEIRCQGHYLSFPQLAQHAYLRPK